MQDKRQRMIDRIFNKADSIYFNEPALTELLFKYMSDEQIELVEREIDTMIEKIGSDQ